MATACGLLLALGAASALDPFVVTFDVTLATGQKDSFDLEVQPDWAPLGAARFKELLDEEFFTSVRFFRVISGFMAQFGIHGKPDVSSKWRERKLKDDPVLQSNLAGTITYATAGPNTRTTQLFINLQDNARLDSQGFAPLGSVVHGMDVVSAIYNPTPGQSGGVSQSDYETKGDDWIRKTYPQINFITNSSLGRSRRTRHL